MDNAEIAAQLTAALELESPPIALSFADAAPAGVPAAEGAVPSACAFWRQAERGSFFAPAAAHYNCPVGAMTMGFELPEQVQQELMGAVTLMGKAGYLEAPEAAAIPSVGRRSAGIVYGPLAVAPLEPDAVLLWLTPRQAMLYNEAAGGAQWTASPLTVRGRPACAAIPLALGDGQSTLSLGCMGMRTFTQIADDWLLVVLPGARAAKMAESLGSIARANAAMRDYYQQKKAMFD